MMRPSFNLGVNLSTAQKLTPQMQQAIKLLQLSSLELEQEVQMKLDSNPLLERVEEDEISAEDFNSLEELTRLELDTEAQKEVYELSNDYSEGYENDSYDSKSESLETDKYDLSAEINDNQQNVMEVEVNSPTQADDSKNREAEELTEGQTLGELSIDTDWEDIFTHGSTALARPDTQAMSDYQGATSVTLQDHIRWQLNFSHLNPQQSLIADYLIDAMDESGFIQADMADLKASFDEMASFYGWEDNIEHEHIEVVIRLIQSCEPLGVGARSLAECLQIQLRSLEETVSYREQALRLLDEHQLLVSNNIKELMHRTGLKNSDIGPSLALIRTLNAAPGLAFSTAQPDYGIQPEVYDIPDVLVYLVNNSESKQAVWKVELNPETLPKLRINQEYANLIKRGDDSPDNVYLRDNLVDARLFIRSIEERNQNLLKVATSIIKLQQDFLLKGPTAMKPLILNDIAEEVGLHESTVSRLTTSKTILTPQGLYSLKHFFSSHVSSDQGDISSTAISAMIKEFIQQEDAKAPLSDSAIQSLLEQQGIKIARRTVAKYREAMNIGSSTQRKIKF
ncbi:RNA polymerase sigma-54 factor [Psychrobacter pasteurii]|uniref:RNA polymerase sigma-54 factor n=1 Tax=Psychrobacter pasteurii TaxID=1945520 RepID=A0A1R4EF33_9GAMM|nr:RNA polymerase factor sigma-54 [Psychrobacter pasteurii]SJM37092.1 RNA polymerase sigma-54 factor [Psychrobacter pasteurii]